MYLLSLVQFDQFLMNASLLNKYVWNIIYIFRCYLVILAPKSKSTQSKCSGKESERERITDSCRFKQQHCFLWMFPSHSVSLTLTHRLLSCLPASPRFSRKSSLSHSAVWFISYHIYTHTHSKTRREGLNKSVNMCVWLCDKSDLLESRLQWYSQMYIAVMNEATCSNYSAFAGLCNTVSRF